MERKIDAILKYPTPSNITELRRFMGMVQQVSKFTPELARASGALRDILSSKNIWIWTKVHDVAFAETKKILTELPVLAHYDLTKETKIRTDGSKLNGISAILFQLHDSIWKPVAFASRYLTSTEQNYHSIEIEMLAAVWVCEKMTKYLHGLNNFIIQTDHKPLIPIINSKSLTGIKFPSKLKLADISPIHKKLETISKGNYRPISVLPVVTKIFERIMDKQTNSYLEKYLSPYLCGYRKGYSCQHALLIMIERWKACLDKGGFAGGVLMDLSKAFDTINHKLLIAKLSAYGFDLKSLEIIYDYLSSGKELK